MSRSDTNLRRNLSGKERAWRVLQVAAVGLVFWVFVVTWWAWQLRPDMAGWQIAGLLPTHLWTSAHLHSVIAVAILALALAGAALELVTAPGPMALREAVGVMLIGTIAGLLALAITSTLLTDVMAGVHLQTTNRGFYAYGLGNPILTAGQVAVAMLFGWLTGWGMATTSDRVPRHAVRDTLLRRGAAQTMFGNDLVAERRQQFAAGALMIGLTPIAPRDETGHLLICGSPGTGKSVAMHQMLSVIRRRNQLGLCMDWDGLYLSRHFRPGDALFNPWDRRGVRWSPFAEIREDADCDLIARLMVPPPRGGGKQAEWAEFAGKFVAALLRGLRGRPDASPALLHDAIFEWPSDKLAPLLAGTSSAQWLAPENAEFFGSARGSAIRYLSFLKTLGDVRTPAAFSIRDWVAEERRSGAWLFLSCRNRHRASAQQIVSALVALAITETLDLPETHEPADRLWFFCDEIDQSGYIAEFEKGLTLARKHGGAFVLGMQTVGQLDAIYGPADARAIRGSCNTQLVLRCSDPDTAEAMSRAFGDRDLNRESISHTTGKSTSKTGDGKTDNTARSIHVVSERAVSPGQILYLKDLSGYTKLKTGFEATELHITDLPVIADAFQPTGTYQHEDGTPYLTGNQTRDHTAAVVASYAQKLAAIRNTDDD